MSRLRFHDCLGRGGYGAVYRATWFTSRGMQLEVAVKVLNATVARGSDAQRRLRDEARLLGALTHPGILRVYDLVEIRGAVAMIAEFVEGQDLDRCVLDGLPPRSLVEVVSKVASALAAAWGDLSPVSGKPLRLVHRDIKPENLRVTPTGVVKILDFGVARAAELRRESETASNMVLGSYRYMAPERFDAGLEPHPSLDVFALGAILYEGLAFRRLFEHLSVREMLVLSVPGSDRYEQYIDDRIAELPQTADPDLIALIRRLVSREPADRPMPGRLAAICDDLTDALAGRQLGQWCRSRAWEYVSAGDGELTGTEVELEEGHTAAISLPQWPSRRLDPATGELKPDSDTMDVLQHGTDELVSLQDDDPDLLETVKETNLPTPTAAPPKRRGVPTPTPAPPQRSQTRPPVEPDPDPATEGLDEIVPRELDWEDDPDEMATQQLSRPAIEAMIAAKAAQALAESHDPAELDDLDPTSGLLRPEQAQVEPTDGPLPDEPTQPDAVDLPLLETSMPKLYAAELMADLPTQEEDDTVETRRPAPVGNPVLMGGIAANIAVILVLTLLGTITLIAWVVLAT